MAPENASFNQPIRELFFGSGTRGTYRFLFVVFEEEKSVYVLHVRHGSMLPLSPGE
jgi:phage-related protein